jgi:hypothetical protein
MQYQQTFATVPRVLPVVQQRPATDVLVEGIERIINLFRLNFYMIDSQVTAINSMHCSIQRYVLYMCTILYYCEC